MRYWIMWIVVSLSWLITGWALRTILASWADRRRDDDFDEPYSTWRQLRDCFNETRRSLRSSWRTKWFAFVEWWQAHRRGWVRFPAGSVRIIGIRVGGAEQMVEGSDGQYEVPCELFDGNAVGTQLFIRAAAPGVELAIIFANRGAHDVSVQAAMLGTSNDNHMMCLSWPVIELKAGQEQEVAVRPVCFFVPRKLVVKLPNYVPPAKAA